MSWQIKQDGRTQLLALEGELGIQDAAAFHQAVLPLAALDGAVRVDAHAAKSVHTSVMQILYALSKAIPDFAVTETSDEFRATEARLGFCLARSGAAKTPANQTGKE